MVAAVSADRTGWVCLTIKVHLDRKRQGRRTPEQFYEARRNEFAIRAKIEKASFHLDFVELALDLREALILKRIERPHGQDRRKQDPFRWDSP